MTSVGDPALTFDVFLEHVVDDGVDVLVDVLEEEREAVLDGHLQLFQEVGVVERAHLHKQIQIFECAQNH